MSQFNERKAPKTEVKNFRTPATHKTPTIYIDPTALTKMQLFVEECKDEIGWLGTATRDADNDIIIHDVHLFDQEVHSTTTEITPEGLMSFAELLLQLPDGMEIWNNMRVWGHSHVNMGVFASGQDDSQMVTFSESGQPWFIRLIANKPGEMKIDLFDYEKNLVFIDCPWETMVDQEEEAIHVEINRLYHLLDKRTKDRVDEHKEAIKADMKDKVRTKTYNYAGYNYTGRGAVQGSLYGGKTLLEQAYEDGTLEKKGELIVIGGRGSESATENMDFGKDDVLTSDDDVYTFIGDARDLYDLSFAKTLPDLRDELACLGIYNIFSNDDLIRIKKVADDVAYHVDKVPTE